MIQNQHRCHFCSNSRSRARGIGKRGIEERLLDKPTDCLGAGWLRIANDDGKTNNCGRLAAWAGLDLGCDIAGEVLRCPAQGAERVDARSCWPVTSSPSPKCNC